MKVFGAGAVNVAGHKVSYGLLAAGAGIVGAVLLFIQMRKAGSSVGAGTTPSTGYTDAQGNAYDQYGNLVSSALPSSSASGADWQSAFAALSSQIGALSLGTSAAPSMAAPISPGAVAAASGYQNYATQWGNTGAQTGQPGAGARDVSTVTTKPLQTVMPRAPLYPSGPGIDATTFPGTGIVTIVSPPKPTYSWHGNPGPTTTVKKYVIDYNTPAAIPFNPFTARSSGSQAVA